jgi:hypothetical protein
LAGVKNFKLSEARRAEFLKFSPPTGAAPIRVAVASKRLCPPAPFKSLSSTAWRKKVFASGIDPLGNQRLPVAGVKNFKLSEAQRAEFLNPESSVSNFQKTFFEIQFK